MSTQPTIEVYEGMDVVGSDGEKLGSVDRVEGNFIVAKKGFFFPTDYYVPADAVASVDESRVYLNIPKDVVLEQGWDTPIYDDTTTDTTTANATGDTWTNPAAASAAGIAPTDYAETESRLDDPLVGDEEQVALGDDTYQVSDERTDFGDDMTDKDTIRVPLAEEELSASRRTVERGTVHVEKDVETEDRTIDVPVREEHVQVNRRVVDRDVRPGDEVFTSDSIDVPVRGEEVDVQKQARVVEELEISKDATAETRHVSDTVRRERARVTDTTGDVDAELVDDAALRKSRK